MREATDESKDEYDCGNLYLMLEATSFCFGFCWGNFEEYFIAVEGYRLTTESLCDFIDDESFLTRMLKIIYALVEAHDRARVEYSKQDLHVAMLRIVDKHCDQLELLKLVIDVLFLMVRTCGAMVEMERFHGKMDEFACRVATLPSVTANTRQYARDIRNSIIQYYTIRETAMAELCSGFVMPGDSGDEGEAGRIISFQDDRVLSLMEFIYSKENRCDNSGEWTDDDKSVNIADYCVKRRSDMNGMIVDVPVVLQETLTVHSSEGEVEALASPIQKKMQES
jgi:hypothetical protein